jgi:hypothetical protein
MRVHFMSEMEVFTTAILTTRPSFYFPVVIEINIALQLNRNVFHLQNLKGTSKIY